MIYKSKRKQRLFRVGVFDRSADNDSTLTVEERPVAILQEAPLLLSWLFRYCLIG